MKKTTSKIVTYILFSLIMLLSLTACKDFFNIDRQTDLESISIDTSAAKTSYVVNSAFSSAGLVIYGHYSDSSIEEEPVTLATFTGFDSSAAANSQIITVSYKGFKTSFPVNIIAAEIESIAITKNPKQIYQKGDSFDSSSMVVTGYYSDGSTANVTSDCEVSGFSSTKAGQSLFITVTHTPSGLSVQLLIYIDDKKLTGITVENSKTIYAVGEDFDKDALTVTGIYNDGESTATIASSYFTVTGFDSSAATGSQTLTITVNSISETIQITIMSAFLCGIEVTTEPDKLIYASGETLDITGMKVYGVYTDGENHGSELSGYTCSKLTSATGFQVITVTYVVPDDMLTKTKEYYEGKTSVTYTTTFNVAVSNKTLSSISATSSKTEYYQGESFDSKTLTVTASYSDNTSETISYYSVSGFDSSTVTSSQTITVSTLGKSATFTIQILAAKLLSISLPATSFSCYELDETSFKANLIVYGTFSNGTVVLSTSQFDLSGYPSTTTEGTYTITVSPTYTPAAEGISTTVTLTVSDKITVSYNLNGYSGTVPSSFSIIPGKTHTVESDPGRTGYTCSTWNTKASGTGTGYTAGQTYAFTSSCTLYAQWMANTYTITYYDEGGSSFSGTHESGYPTSHTYGTATSLDSPSKSLYMFKGWYTDSACSGTAITTLSATGYTDAVSLYAKWD
jgi:uncharacterized repeat protein (TIGR02543 family)